MPRIRTLNTKKAGLQSKLDCGDFCTFMRPLKDGMTLLHS